VNPHIARVTSKGRIVIPSQLRRKFGIGKGTRISITTEDQRIVLQPLTRAFIRSLQGSLKRKPSALELLLRKRRNRGR
jgi:AbrB family looped-hinge helix DNA binding protein